jgi:hypothetical protein
MEKEKDPSLNEILQLYADQGVTNLYVKKLAPNDNSKNQIYLSGSFSTLNLIPHCEDYKVSKITEKNGAVIHSKVNFFWLNAFGVEQAEYSKLILYPKYPEVRLSGFLQGCKSAPSKWMKVPEKHERPFYKGRFLFLGIEPSGKIIAYLSIPHSSISLQVQDLISKNSCDEGVLLDVTSLLKNHSKAPFSFDTWNEVSLALKKIHEKGWIKGKRLKKGALVNYNKLNGGGYTLEAELGIEPNGYAEPDYLGWEVKSFKVKDFSKLKGHRITLFTPEPDGGIYNELSFLEWIKTYGYPDTLGRPDRLNFGGYFRVGKLNERTGLTLEMSNFNEKEKTNFTFEGILGLIDKNNKIAASWSYKKLISHWKKKHNKAVYVPALKESFNGHLHYNYSPFVLKGEGTDFFIFLSLLKERFLFLDPGMKVENVTTYPKIHKRSQFRMLSTYLDKMYYEFNQVDVR